jgi:hypothetical protein
MIYCGKAEFGQISRSFSLNSGAILLKRPKNLTQIDIPSLRSVKSDRLLARILHEFRRLEKKKPEASASGHSLVSF